MLITHLIIGIGLSLALGPISSFIIWNGFAYLSDAIAHATLLGMVISILSGINSNILMVGTSVLIAVLLLVLKSNKQYATDTLISIISQSLLSIGLVLASLFPETKEKLSSFLFGDISKLTWHDGIMIYCAAIAIIITISLRWTSWVSVSLNPDLAKANGINTSAVQAEYTIILAVITALAIKIVGALLIVAVLIISPAIARRLAKTPQYMMIYATLICMIEIVSGITISSLLNIPAGPTITAVGFIIFLVVNFAYWITSKKYSLKSMQA